MSIVLGDGSVVTTIAELSSKNLLVESVDKDVYELESNKAAFLKMLKKNARERSVNRMDSFRMLTNQNNKFKYTVKSYDAGTKTITLNGTADGALVALQNMQVDDGIMIINPNSAAKNFEERLITTITADGATDVKVTISAAFSNGNPAAGDIVFFSSKNASERSEAKKALSQELEGDDNSIGLFRATVGKGILADKSAQYINAYKKDKERLLAAAPRLVESKILFSRRQALTGSDGTRIYEPYGFFAMMQDGTIRSTLRDSKAGITAGSGAQYYDWGNAITIDSIKKFALQNRLGSKKKTIFMDNVLLSAFNMLMWNKTTPQEYDKEINLHFTRFMMCGVEFTVVGLDLLDDLYYANTTTNTYRGIFFCVDWANIGRVYFNDFNKFIIAKVLLANNILAENEEIITTVGIEAGSGETHCWGTHSIAI